MGLHGGRAGRCWGLKWGSQHRQTLQLRQQDSQESDRPGSKAGGPCLIWVSMCAVHLDSRTDTLVPTWEDGGRLPDSGAALPETHPHKRILELAGE